MLPVNVRLSTVKLLANTSSHLLFAKPNVYVFDASGTKFDATSALIVIVSVSWSPIWMFPSALILPVAWILPSTLVSPRTSTVPVPLGIISKFWFVSVAVIVLPSMIKSSTNSLLLYTALSGVARFSWFPVVVIELALIVTLLICVLVETCKSVVLIVPATSKGYWGLVVLTPILSLFTSMYN